MIIIIQMDVNFLNVLTWQGHLRKVMHTKDILVFLYILPDLYVSVGSTITLLTPELNQRT